ncbi:type II toxin-antitoxin system RelE/ParE family toxin [Embleya sp. NPDC020886]|uniref:type II toxin-antitoxin system RelE/ParE family toxin n=1 Tax=Embleya sp. NPDC020886 TaxID=3363980 RepID=UPI0037941183
MLADRATTLGEPYARHLGGGLRELRFHLDRRPIRITYRLAAGRRIILPTVFAKTRIVEQLKWSAPGAPCTNARRRTVRQRTSTAGRPALRRTDHGSPSRDPRWPRPLGTRRRARSSPTGGI